RGGETPLERGDASDSTPACALGAERLWRAAGRNAQEDGAPLSRRAGGALRGTTRPARRALAAASVGECVVPTAGPGRRGCVESAAHGSQRRCPPVSTAG